MKVAPKVSFAPQAPTQTQIRPERDLSPTQSPTLPKLQIRLIYRLQTAHYLLSPYFKWFRCIIISLKYNQLDFHHSFGLHQEKFPPEFGDLRIIYPSYDTNSYSFHRKMQKGNSEEALQSFSRKEMRLTEEQINLTFCQLLEVQIDKEYTAGMLQCEQTVVFDRMRTVFPVLNRLGLKETWQSLLKGSNFDAISFVRYYGSSVYRVGRAEFHHAQIPSSEHNSVWSRYSREEIHGLAFNLKKRQLATKSVLDLQKENSTKLFIDHLSGFFSAIVQSKLEFNKNLHPAVGDEEIWWATLRDTPNADEMLPVHTETISHFSKLLACILENVFSNRERVRRFSNVWTKVPQTMLITSLYILNPAPFVTKIMGLFLWKPSVNALSFCQRIASSLVGVSKTVASINAIRLEITPSRASQIEALLKSEKGGLSSYSSVIDFKMVLNIDDDSTDSINEIEYAKCIIRKEEKMQYVDFLGVLGHSPILDLLSEYLPILLREIGRIGSMSTMVQLLFNLINKFLEILNKSVVEPRPSQLDVIKDLHETFYQFMLDFYPFLHKASLLSNTNDKLVVFPVIIDSLLGLFLGWKSHANKDSNLHQNLKTFLQSLGPEEQIEISKHLETVVKLSEKGIDESGWPKCSLLDTKVVDVAVQEYLKVLGNFE